MLRNVEEQLALSPASLFGLGLDVALSKLWSARLNSQLCGQRAKPQRLDQCPINEKLFSFGPRMYKQGTTKAESQAGMRQLEIPSNALHFSFCICSFVNEIPV